jgi:hypothetical protein
MTQTQTPAPPALQGFDASKIPQSLKDIPRWVLWKATWMPKRGKYDKRPVFARAPHYGASTTNPKQWIAFDEAHLGLTTTGQGFDGMGLCVTGVADLVSIDLDKCVDDNVIAPWAADIVRSMASYTEISPSGKGLRIFVQGNFDFDWTNHEVGIEVYAGHGGRFLTVTGQRLKTSPHELRRVSDDELEALATLYAKTREKADVISLTRPDLVDEMLLPALSSLSLPPAVERFLTDGDTNGDRSRILWASAIALHNNGLSQDEVFSFLVHNPHSMGVALDHRQQDFERAETYIWTHHAQKAKAKSNAVASMADFENLARVSPEVSPVGEERGEEQGGAPELKQGSADDFDVLDEGVSPIHTPAAKPSMRFAMQKPSEWCDRPDPVWLVDDVVPDAELIVVYGESTAGKSFVTMDLVGAIALGREWRGHEVQQGRVAYVVAEGGAGFRKRVRAYAMGQGLTLADLDDKLYIIDAAPNFMVKDDVMDVCKSILAHAPVDVVVLDTWAQVLPGANENAGEDMGKALAHCKGVHKATGATVILVHHAGKDTSKGARGWSGLRAAADAEFEVAVTKAGRTIKNTKQKDGESGQVWGFGLQTVDTRKDLDAGKPITSCYVVACAVPLPDKGGAGANKNGGKWAARVLEVLGEFSLAQTTGIERKEVVAEVARRSPDEGEDPTGRIRRQRASSALKLLLEDEDSGYLLEDDGTVTAYE